MKLIVTFLTVLLIALVIPLAEGGVALTTLHSFSGPDGANPAGGLVRGADGNLYETTSDDYFTSQFGTVFRITHEGVFTNLYSLKGGDEGAWPHFGLVLGSDGNFYGTTAYRGANFKGTIFKITPSGDFSTLVALDSFSGSPGSLLVPANDGKFYSVGNFGFGTGLTQGRDGNLYGTTGWGGPAFIDNPIGGGGGGHGTAFKLTTNGVLTTLAVFNGTNGYGPNSLVQASNGDFYGTTYGLSGGGTSLLGTIFKLTAGGSLTSLFSFNGTNGTNPKYATLLKAANGVFYGTTYSGGASNYGTIFRLSLTPSTPVIQTVTRT